MLCIENNVLCVFYLKVLRVAQNIFSQVSNVFMTKLDLPTAKAAVENRQLPVFQTMQPNAPPVCFTAHTVIKKTKVGYMYSTLMLTE